MNEPHDTLKSTLDAKSKDELNVLGQRFDIKGYRRMKKAELVTALLAIPQIESKMRVTWWDLHHNHVYGGVSVVALILSIAFYVWPIEKLNESNSTVIQFNQYESLKLNLERRNSIQNRKFSTWISKTQTFRKRYHSKPYPANIEYEQFLADFTSFAESNFTPLQIKSFGGLETGIGGEMFRRPDSLPDEFNHQYVQLASIEAWLTSYRSYNRKSEEPLDPDKMML